MPYLSAETVPLVIEGNEWVFALLGLCLAVIFILIGVFFFAGRRYKKARDGFPALSKKEKKQEERLQ